MKLLFIFAFGATILISAILLNVLASKLNILTWYDFLKEPSKAGLLDYVWLFIVYPFCLGAVAYYAVKIFT